MLAVADGAGSARFSAAGAHLAVSVATALTERLFARVDWARAQPADLEARLRDVLGSTARAVRSAVDATGVQGSRSGGQVSFESTLTLAVLAPPWLCLLRVGDGFVVLDDGGQSRVWPAGPQPSGDSSLTTFLTMAQAPDQAMVQALRLPDLRAVALGTDGLDGIVVVPGPDGVLQPFPEFFDVVLPGVADGSVNSGQLLSMLRSKHVQSATDDDVTLVLAVRRSEQQAHAANGLPSAADGRPPAPAPKGAGGGLQGAGPAAADQGRERP